MSFWSALTGEDAADASRAAAQDTYAKQTKATEGLNKFGTQYASNFQNLYQPYANTGGQANTALQQLIADPSSVRSLPGYQFAQDEGIQALDRSANARHMLNSGRQEKDLLRFGTGLADQTYGNQFSRLMGGAGLGLQGNAGIGQGLQGQLGARQTAYGGQMNAAGTIGQGDVAAANAQAAGTQNLLNSGLKLGGMALGAFAPATAFGGGGAFGSLLGGGSSYGSNAPSYPNPYGGSWYS